MKMSSKLIIARRKVNFTYSKNKTWALSIIFDVIGILISG